MAESVAYENYDKLVQWLHGGNKIDDLDNIDLGKALEDFAKKFLPNTSVEEDPTNNFTYAGRVLQSSANLYADKVDDLDNYVRLLMDDLTTRRKRSEKKAEKVNESMMFDDDWHDILDEIKIGEHIYLTEEDEAEREPIEYITDPPSCMAVLNNRSENRIPLHGYHGEFLAYQQDLAMGSSWTMSSTGAFSLSMNYNIPKDDPIQEGKEGNVIGNADDALIGAVGGEIAVVDGEMKDLSDDIDEPPADDGNELMHHFKKEHNAQQNRKKERILKAMEPHDPYEVIELRNKTNPKKKIHQPINKQKTGNTTRHCFNAGYLLNKKPLGKGIKKPHDCFKDIADKEFLARKKNLKERAIESKGISVESTDDEDDQVCSDDDDDQGFDPINFDDLIIHDDDEYDEDERMQLTVNDTAARNAAARKEIDTEENKNTYKSWTEHIKQVQEEEKDLEFDIGKTMNEILKCLERKSDIVPFCEVAPMISAWDVNKVFLGTLILANHGNLDIIERETDSHPECYSTSDLPLNKVLVKLINTEKTEDHIRPFYEIEAEQRNRKNTKRRSSSRVESPECQPHSSKMQKRGRS